VEVTCRGIGNRCEKVAWKINPGEGRLGKRYDEPI
jgi:hypothetical protein